MNSTSDLPAVRSERRADVRAPANGFRSPSLAKVFKAIGKVALSCLVAMAVAPGKGSAFQGEYVQVSGQGKETFGRALFHSRSTTILLRRDGRIVEFQSAEGFSARPVSQVFEPYSALKLQEHFKEVFGRHREVSLTANYVVVHPRGKGERARWADPYQELYGQFTRYFAARGFDLREPEFPLVVVVAESPQDFARIAASDGLESPENWAGYYSQRSNWIVTRGWVNQEEARSTLIHEALHQFAYNRGLHTRYAETPRWGVEGLAVLFEAPGVHDSLRYSSDRDRIHPAYLQWMKRNGASSGDGTMLQQLVSSDALFDEDPESAYVWSWALVWYLVETRPAQFNEWLQRTARRPRLVPSSGADRLADFQDVFGISFPMLESHLLRFIADQ